jgi:hypothetical protein
MYSPATPASKREPYANTAIVSIIRRPKHLMHEFRSWILNAPEVGLPLPKDLILADKRRLSRWSYCGEQRWVWTESPQVMCSLPAAKSRKAWSMATTLQRRYI